MVLIEQKCRLNLNCNRRNWRNNIIIISDPLGKKSLHLNHEKKCYNIIPLRGPEEVQ